MHMDNGTKWIRRWKCWVAPTRLPGVWRRQEGGHLVRVRVVDPTTGRTREIKRVLPNADELTAFTWLTEERERIRSGALLAPPQRMRFAEYAASLLERKVTVRDIKSARSRERWGYTLEHLIGGTGDVPGFGEMFLGEMRTLHVEQWRVGIARLIAAGRYAPGTTNGWLAILKTITKSAKRELGLALDPADGVRSFDTSECPTYTEEQPNSLPPEKVGEFLAHMRESYPEHYTMTFLGLTTGLRPSHMRPLRRSGATPDVRWQERELLVRRSHTMGDEIMETTKTKRRQRIGLPSEVIDVLQWHVDTQLTTPEQKASELLFPGPDGRLLTEHCLRSPFACVGESMGLQMRFTPRGLRRTFVDLARAAQIESLISMSISGHATCRMREHYSTVQPVEQREGIGRMLRLVKSGPITDDASRGGAPGGAPVPSSGAPAPKAG